MEVVGPLSESYTNNFPHKLVKHCLNRLKTNEFKPYFERTSNILALFLLLFYCFVLSYNHFDTPSVEVPTKQENKFPMRQSKVPITPGTVPLTRPTSILKGADPDSLTNTGEEKRETLHSPDVSIICCFQLQVEQMVFLPL